MEYRHRQVDRVVPRAIGSIDGVSPTHAPNQQPEPNQDQPAATDSFDLKNRNSRDNENSDAHLDAILMEAASRIAEPEPLDIQPIQKSRPIQPNLGTFVKPSLISKFKAAGSMLVGSFQSLKKFIRQLEFKLPNINPSQARLFAAGGFFAVGLVLVGYSLNNGPSKQTVVFANQPSAEASSVGSTDITEVASVSSSGDSLLPAEIEVDEGIDVMDVDWRPPKPITAEMPARLIIDKIGVNAKVRSLGLTSEGALAVPNYSNQVGWYDQSVAPGQPGTAVMDGHYGGVGVDAVFKKLDQLIIGDQISVQRGDGSLVDFEVVAVEGYETGTVPMDKLIESDGKTRLNIITCNGDWNGDDQTYDRRLVVYAVAV